MNGLLHTSNAFNCMNKCHHRKRQRQRLNKRKRDRQRDREIERERGTHTKIHRDIWRQGDGPDLQTYREIKRHREGDADGETQRGREKQWEIEMCLYIYKY